ncbi:DUF2889 domain-containing protein [Pusillimonas noertemannii]|uniref:DUF2889 family protein n=1 Tax=Pusillimonas noertemannii TaxID=305977 RepID=A0A2U1CK65_9BURK|nr:DUF2889 domain-containing protein [Pusillimonas noertemannii]PVY61407.1 hypothetical protein C7440_2958 [Pusillimonas noertemannii]
MPLPLPDVPRKLLHTRSVRVDAYARDDDQWDLDAELIDVKGYDFPRENGTIHKMGDPVHHMHLRVTVDNDFTITAAQAAYDAAPFDENCFCIASAYQDLVGLNLLRRFRDAVKGRFGRVAGCTHLTELSYLLPTVAVQCMAGRKREERARGGEQSDKKPFELDGCHALRVDGPVAAKHYPQWYAAPQGKARQE